MDLKLIESFRHRLKIERKSTEKWQKFNQKLTQKRMKKEQTSNEIGRKFTENRPETDQKRPNMDLKRIDFK